MKTIGIKLADGSFYPILEEGTAKTYQLDLTTVKDGQTKVQIDLYRSESGTMEDAQYVDTLEVSNLVPHPNGEADLHLSVALNDKNELDARVIDEETGRQSQTTVTLVSRTLAERADPVNFELSEEPKVVPELPEDDFFAEDFGTGIDVEDVPAVEVDSSVEGESVAEDEFSDKGESLEETASPVEPASLGEGESAVEDASSGESSSSVEGASLEESASSVEPASLDKGESAVEDASSEEGASAVEGAVFDDEEVPFSFDRELAEGETVSLKDPTLGEENFEEDFFIEEKSPAEDTEPLEESTFPVEPASPGEDTTSVDGTVSGDEPVFAEDTFSVEDAPLAEENITASLPAGEETVISQEDSAASIDSFDSLKSEDFDLPDFDDIPEESQPRTEGLTGYFDDPDFKDDPVFSETNLDTTGREFDTSDLDFPETGTSTPAMDFSDLYDKETLDGKTSVYDEEEETEKKTRVPVIICIVCAIICVIATLLILFVVPSKYNLIKNHKKPDLGEQTSEVLTEEPDDTPSTEQDSSISIELEETEAAAASEEPESAEEEPAPEAPQAVEDEIVVAPEPEAVVPVPPAPKKEEAKDVKYRIRWGDTLWDISDAYYKNPWRYHKIAKYNNIKNPDLIISGTDILIPVE